MKMRIANSMVIGVTLCDLCLKETATTTRSTYSRSRKICEGCAEEVDREFEAETSAVDE